MGRHEYTISGDPENVLKKLKAGARRYGITFSGDSSRGTLSGMGLDASYSRVGNRVIVDIRSTPLIMSEQTIAEKIAEFLG